MDMGKDPTVGGDLPTWRGAWNDEGELEAVQQIGAGQLGDGCSIEGNVQSESTLTYNVTPASMTKPFDLGLFGLLFSPR
jgi:hypothetical protein